jgi:hypothetical protein
MGRAEGLAGELTDLDHPRPPPSGARLLPCSQPRAAAGNRRAGQLTVAPRGLRAELPAGCLVFAVDVTTWPRCDAECSPERGYYYHPSRHSAGQPIVTGWAYQWIAHVSFDRDSWTAPVDARRLHPLDDADQTAAAQLRALLVRLPADGPVPLVVFDAGYDSAQLTLDLAEARVAVLVRLRADRCFYADPPPRPPGSTGRPRRHGAKFNCADATTWPAPTATHVVVDDQYGTVTVQA